MWNPKSSSYASGKNDSVSKEDNNLAKNSKKEDVTLGEKSEVENLSGGVDSGFLSGPQLSYESESCELGPQPSLPKPEATTNQRPNITKESEKEYSDSGCLEDIDVHSSSEKKASSHMLLDSGVDAGLTEWFCNLSLKTTNQPLNDLGESSKESAKNSPELNISGEKLFQKNKAKDAWEIFYQQNEDGDTQLHLACITGYVEVILALIRLAPHACLLDIQNDAAQSALHIAVLTGQPKIVRILLVAGAEASSRDSNGNTPLHLACISGDLECVKALTIPFSASEIQEAKRLNISRWEESLLPRCFQLPPDLETRNYDGERCVHLAAQGNYIDVLRHLIWYGADINAREGKSGCTPLHIAIETHNELLANFLLEECQKLNLETATYAGLTAYQLAVIIEDRQMQNYLERHGAERLTPPESDDESDLDYDEVQMYDRFGDPGYFVSSSFSGSNPINVM